MRKFFFVLSLIAVSFFSSNLFAEDLTVFGPQTYTRTTGASNLYIGTFDAIDIEGRLVIRNGAEDGQHRVTSGTITVNGVKVFTTEDFKQGDYLMECPVDLTESNLLTVELNSKPDTYLSVEILHENGYPVASLQAEPLVVVQGHPTTLTWTTLRADTVTIKPDIGEVDQDGSISVSPTKTTTYTITATGPGGTATDTVTVTVIQPSPTISITANPETIQAGESSTLTWTSTYADFCVIDQGIGSVSMSGSLMVSPTETTTYTIMATGPGGTATANVTITVIHPLPTVAISAVPTPIIVGEASTLSWTSTDAATCAITPDIGSVDLNGSLTVTPAQTTTYTLTATGPGGTVTGSVTVTVNPVPVPTVSLTANPESIYVGGASVLSWDSANITDAVIDQGIGAVVLSGSMTVSPTVTTTYTITGTGTEGAATDSVTITVSEPPQPIVNISAIPLTITLGETSQLSWSSQYADSCTISPDLGTVALSGSETVSPDRTAIYTITATGPGGTSTDQVKITVTAQTEPQPEGSFGSRYEDLIPPDAILQTYDSERFSLINGSVFDPQDAPIGGVNISILHHPEYGTALTDSNGKFALPVEGGASLTVVYTYRGLITSHRSTDVPWNGFAVIDPIVMIPEDTKSTTITFDGNPDTVMTHTSTAVTDEFGTRSCTLVFTGDNAAHEVDASGNLIRELASGTVRATEFATIDEMPAVLPPTSAYTYCAELSFDGAQRVQFDQPVVMWVNNFLGFDTGSIVPVGSYDRDKGEWIPSGNGLVVTLLDTDNDGVVDAIDANGDNLADDLNGDGATTDEAKGLQDPSTFVPGTSYWRSEITHFSPWDCNWPYGFGEDDTEPNAEGQPDTDSQKDGEPCKTCTNSFVADRSRVYNEDIPIPGTDMTLHYASNRVNDYLSVIKVPASGDTVSTNLRRIDVYLYLAGQKFHQTLDPSPDQIATFKWDGTDFRGDPVSGPVKGRVWIGFVYNAVYYESRSDLDQSFAQAGAYVTNIRTRYEVISWRKEDIDLNRDHPDAIADGWTLSPHHRFYPIDLTHIYKGDGTTDVYSPDLLARFAGIITPGFSGDDGPASQAQLNYPKGMAADGEGNIYIADRNNNRIRKVDKDGIITTIAGNGAAGYSGDNGPATAAQLQSPAGITLDGDGNLYIADSGNHRIRKVSPDGIITTIAGNGTAGFGGDNGSAIQAQLNTPQDVVIDNFGNIYIADTNSNRIRKIAPNGIITTIAGTGDYGYSGDDGPAQEALLAYPRGIGVGNTGNLFIADTYNNRIRRIDIGGTITSVAGNGTAGFDGEGIAATEASLSLPGDVAVDKEGNLYIADTQNNRIRRVNVKGIIVTLAGDGTIGVKTGVPPKEGYTARPQSIAIDPDNHVYFSIMYPGYYAAVLETGSSGIGSLVSGDGQAYSDPSGETYIIQNGNLHTATTESTTGALLRYFSYDSNDRLEYIYDRGGMNRTTIERDADGVPTAIISPDGIRTDLTVNFQNQLSDVLYPDGGHYTFEYTSGGLLTAETDPNNNRYEHIFNENGRLTDVTDPEGGHWHYDVTNSADGTILTELTTAEGQRTTYSDRTLTSGEYTSLITGSYGGTTDYQKSENGLTVTKSLPCGTDLSFEYAYDPGYHFKYLKSQTMSVPSGLEKVVTEDRLYEDLNNDRVLDKTTKTITVNGNAFTYVIDKPQTQKTLTTPEGRTSASGFDPDTGLTTWTSTPGLFDTNYTYDIRGRLTDVTTNTRESTFTYDTAGNLDAITDPENRTTTYDYDAMGRVIAAHRPDSGSVWFTYDQDGNMTVLTNPLAIDHGFSYNSVNLKTSYQTPLSGSYAYIYDKDRRLIKTIFPSAEEINNVYDLDNPGKLMEVQTPEGNIDYTYYPCGLKVATVSKGIEKIAYDYDGNLLTGQTFSGTLNASVSMTYNNLFDVDSFTYAGGTEACTYDKDGLLTGAGDFTISRNASNGLPESVTNSGFNLSRTFDGYGEIQAQSTTVSGRGVSSWGLTFNNNGKATAKTETVGGSTSNYSYTYDEMGRILTVTKDGALVAEYQYNANGSRTYAMNAQRGISGRSYTYSEEDHLLTAGGVSYSYDPDGFLQTKTDGADVAAYDYSTRGELLSVDLPDGTYIEYVYDPLGRRIAKKVNGSIVEKYLWQGMTQLLAVYDGSDNLLLRFEYADARMPMAMVKEGVQYYLAYDQVGSLRAVADASGNIVKQIDYDSFGYVLNDSNPAFEVPFGFAGGLYDKDTGLVRFGMRDYDPDTGRWTAKDPIGFAGGDTDLYGYVLNDPVNLIDPTGQFGIAGAIVGAIVGAAGGVNSALQNGGGYTSAILGGVAGALVGGAVGSVNMFAASAAGAAAGGIAGGLIGGYAGGLVSGALSPCGNAWDSARGGAVTGLVGGVFAAPVAYLGAIGTVGATAAAAEAAQSAATGTVGLGAEVAAGPVLPSNGIFF